MKCERKFVAQALLKRHLKAVHGVINETTVDDKTYDTNESRKFVLQKGDREDCDDEDDDNDEYDPSILYGNAVAVKREDEIEIIDDTIDPL